MTTTCPVCTATQPDGLLCHACTTKLERALGDVRWIVTELDTAASKQARIGNPSGGGGLARERNPISWGAVEAADTLGNVLTTWARDVMQGGFGPSHPTPIIGAVAVLLFHIDAIRRHPAVAELMDEIVDAVEQARRAVDLATNRTVIFVGPCPEPDEYGRPCLGEVHAYIPTEDDRPSRMQCRYDGDHKWDSTQWLRAGKRISDLAEQQRNEARSA